MECVGVGDTTGSVDDDGGQVDEGGDTTGAPVADPWPARVDLTCTVPHWASVEDLEFGETLSRECPPCPEASSQYCSEDGFCGCQGPSFSCSTDQGGTCVRYCTWSPIDSQVPVCWLPCDANDECLPGTVCETALLADWDMAICVPSN